MTECDSLHFVIVLYSLQYLIDSLLYVIVLYSLQNVRVLYSLQFVVVLFSMQHVLECDSLLPRILPSNRVFSCNADVSSNRILFRHDEFVRFSFVSSCRPLFVAAWIDARVEQADIMYYYVIIPL